MELAALRQEVRNRIGETTADFWTDAEVDNAINEAHRRFVNEEKWEWLYSKAFDSLAATGDGSLELQEGVQFNRHMNIMLTSPTLVYPLLPIRVSPGEGFKARRRFFIIRGFPRWYYIDNEFEEDEEGHGSFTPTIQFIPRPSVDFDVEYQFLAPATDLSSDSDEPIVPETYQGAILAYATGQLWLKELTNGQQKSAEQMALYQKVLLDAQEELRHLGVDDIIAWGKEEPELVGRLTLEDWIFGRIPPSVGT